MCSCLTFPAPLPEETVFFPVLYSCLLFCAGFPGGSATKNLPAVQEMWVRSLGQDPEEGNGNPLQYSCPGNPMDRGAWWATVHGVARIGKDLATKPPPPPLCMGLFPGWLFCSTDPSVCFCTNTTVLITVDL